MYDTAGQEDYDRLRPLDYTGADVVLFWFNVTEPDSYDNVLEKVRVVFNHRKSHDLASLYRFAMLL